MSKFKEYFMCFALGAVIYGLVEVVVRGYTHWTMAIAGGTVLVIFNFINQKTHLGIFARCLIGAAVITAVEFTIGMIVNVGLGWSVWDYSDKPFNVFGQICPFFSVGWFFISIPAFWLCKGIEKHFSLR
ncbi:MAG: hypothetical protein IJ264_06755 [Clostridia bacterium]|nr:hypothetical protein [Clostridia bacterium]